MDTVIEYLALSLNRTARIEWWISYASGEQQAIALLNANKPEALLRGTGRVQTITILSEKYSRHAVELSTVDALLLGAALARIASVTGTMAAEDWEF